MNLLFDQIYLKLGKILLYGLIFYTVFNTHLLSSDRYTKVDEEQKIEEARRQIPCEQEQRARFEQTIRNVPRDKYEQTRFFKIYAPDFNPEYYILLNPNIIGGVIQKAIQGGLNSLEYAKWHYFNHGRKQNLNYLSHDFNPPLYVQLHPELVSNDYAKRQYAHRDLNYT